MRNLFSVFAFLVFLISLTILLVPNATAQFSKFHASMKVAYSLDQYKTESPLGFQLSGGVNLTPFNALLLSFNVYEVYAHEQTIDNGGVISRTGAGGEQLRSVALQYKSGFGNLGKKEVLQNIFVFRSGRSGDL